MIIGKIMFKIIEFLYIFYELNKKIIYEIKTTKVLIQFI